MNRMSAKERVNAAVRHEEADRVPIDYLANAGIDARLKHHYGISLDDDEALREQLQVDMRELQIPYVGPVLHPALPQRAVDPAWGIVSRWIEHESGGYWDYCDFPLKHLDEELAETWPMPDPCNYDYSTIDRQIASWQEKSIWIGNPGLGDILNTTGMLCGMEQVYLSLALEDPNWLQLVDRRLAIQLEVTRRVLERADGAVDLMWLGEDLGSQTGALISMDHYRRVLKPRHKRFVDLARAYDIPVMMHSCGSSSWVFDEFIDLGIQVIDTLQPEAAGMDPKYLKQRYGSSLAFHGGFSTAGKVVDGTTREVLEELEQLLSCMMPGGGYLFSPTHMLQDNSALENVIAVYEALPALGAYRH